MGVFFINIKEKILSKESNYLKTLNDLDRFKYLNKSDDEKVKDLIFYFLTRFLTRGKF